VTKIRASDGSLQGTFSTGATGDAHGITFDGANIWVGDSNAAAITKLRASDGAILGSRNIGTAAWAIAFDGGSHIWVTAIFANQALRFATGHSLVEHSYNVAFGPRGILFDGASAWVACDLNKTVCKITRTAP
jgi:hypothetical protein